MIFLSCTACHQVQPEDELIHGRFCSYCNCTTFSAATEAEYEEREFVVPPKITVRPVSTAGLEEQARRMLKRIGEEA